MKKSVFAILTALILAFTSVSFAAKPDRVGSIRSGVGSLLESLLDRLSEEDAAEEAGAEDEEEGLSFDYSTWRQAIDAYVTEDFGRILEPGDEQILTGFLFTKEDGLFSETEILGRFGLTNYTADGKDLKMKNYASDVLLLTLEKDESGAYKVTAAEHAEDGEQYAESVSAMGKKYGIPENTLQSGLGSWDWLYTLNICTFLESHPQYERIEYQGEMKTAEEIDQIGNDMMLPAGEAAEASETEAGKGKKILGKLKQLVDSIPEDKKEKLDRAAVQVITEIAEESGLSEMLSGLFTADAPEEEAAEAPSFDYNAWREAVDAFVTEDLARELEAGDEQILFTFTFTKEEGFYDDTEILGNFGLANYTADGSDLKQKNYVGYVELLAIEKDETNAYKVTGAERSEDGEKYAESVDAMCAKYGISKESYEGSLAAKDWLDTLTLYMFLDEHPQYERIEYQGELKTKDEISKISDDLMYALYGSPEEGAAE